MSQPALENVDPASFQFANRAADLLTAHQWMDAQTATALAQQPTSDEQMYAQAQAVGQQFANFGAYEQQFYDPILQTQPSVAQASVQHIQATIGPPPATGGIVTLQEALKDDGFLNANPTGVWDKETETAYNNAVNALKNQQYAGAPHKGGNPFTSTVSSLYHAVIHDVTHPWDLAIGWYDSVADALGYFGGWLGTGAGTLGTASTQAHFSGNITRALGHHVTDQQASAAYGGSIGRRLENTVGNALAIGGTASIAKGVGRTVISQAAKGAVSKAAESGLTDAETTKFVKLGQAMSAAQKMGYVGRSVNDVTNALRAGTLPASHELVQRNLGVVTKTLLRAPSKLTGPANRLPSLFTKEWRDAVPALARLAPLAEQIAGDANPGGFVYQIRNLMAQPYRLAPVRAAGIAVQRAQIAALGVHAGVNLLPGSTLQQTVDSAHTGLDSWLDNTTWNALPGVRLSPDLLLLGPLHGDLTGAGRASVVIGDSVRGFQNQIANRLGALGVDAAFQSILGLDRQQLVDLAGSESNLRLWINNKTDQYASDTYVQRQLAQGGYTHTFDGGDSAYEDAAGVHRDAWYKMPKPDREKWVADTATADSHFSWLAARLQTDLLRGAVDPKTAVRESMQDFFTKEKILSGLMDAHLADYILGPASHNALAKAGEIQEPSAVARVAGLPSGAVGLQGAATRTREEILNTDLPALQKTYNDAETAYKAATPEGKAAARQKMLDALEAGIQYAHVQGNLDASRLGVYEGDAQGLWKEITSIASHRASEALPTFDQPDWMAERLRVLKQNGYRVVIGSHIGHAYDNTLPSYTKLDGFYTSRRKWAGRVGLDPGRVPDASVTHAIRANQDALVHKFLTETPGVVLPTPRADFRTVRAVMADKTLARQLPSFASGLLGLFSRVGLNKTEINRILREHGGPSRDFTAADARAELENGIAAQFGPRDIPRQQLIDNLMKTHDVDAAGGGFKWIGVDEKTANGIVDAYYKGYRLPGFMMGWEAIENWARASRGIGSRMVERHPNSSLLQTVNGWPNQLVRARNNLRFTISPIFAARVSFKQRYKAALEGVRIPFNPLAALEKEGATDSALKSLTRLDDKLPHEQLDADRYLMARDVFGIHDSQWDAAYFVHKLKAQGKTPEQVKDAYNRVFKYGADGGRTSAERTLNTIFFPFSFEKTLLRNTGAYLADRPGQALALDLAVEEWRQADKNGVIGQWVDDHLPILREMQLLNAFAHGISPGQFGGINATLLNDTVGGSEALLNLFLPQAWGPNLTKPNLTKYMPIWGELKNLFADVAEQGNIAAAAAHDTTSHILGLGWKPEPALTQRAQTSYALRAKAQILSDPNVMKLIDYNDAQTDDADKYLWPEDDRLPVDIWNHPVNKTTLTAYLESLYPAYNPDAGAAYAKDQAAQLSLFIHNVSKTDPVKAQQMAAFRKVADSIVSSLNRDRYDQATAAAAQAQFQKAAPFFNSDPDWKTLYNQFYAWSLGQIQTPQQKAGAV